MKKAVLFIAIAISLVPAAIGQSSDVGVRAFQNQVICGPLSSSGQGFTQKFAPNNNYDFVGYLNLNVYNCTANTFYVRGREAGEQPARRERTTVRVAQR